MTEKLVRILLVEDNPGDARLLSETLRGSAQGAGFHIVQAGRLGEALALAAREPFDVMLLDLSLPDSEGLETVTRAHAAAPGLPIVVMTGLDREEVGMQALQQGAQDYLVKGMAEPRPLVRSLHYAIYRRAMEVQSERHLGQLNNMVDASAGVMAQTTVQGLMQQLTLAACDITGACQLLAGNLLPDGMFEVKSHRSCPDGDDNPPLESLRLDPDPWGPLMTRGGTLRMSEQEARLHQPPLALPFGEPGGLLAAALIDRDGRPCGLVIASGGIQDEFAAEYEALLGETAALASLALQHIEAQQSLQQARDLLETRVRQRTADLSTAVEALQGEVRQRIAAEGQLREANRALTMFSKCDQAIARGGDETKMLEDVCRSIVQVGGYRLAWVGMAEQDAARTVRPVAQNGYEEGYLQAASITWADTERGRGPTGTAIRTGQVVIGRDFQRDPELAPWRDEAVKRGFASSIAIPLDMDGRTVGCLTIYAAQADAFDEGEQQLLSQLAKDVSFGITALRSHGERRRLESEVLRTSEMERQRIGHDLHDSLGQTLTGIAFMCNVLRSVIKEGSPHAADDAANIERLVNESVALTRALARGLSPVGLSVDSLATGLYEMAATAEEMFRVSCTFHCPQNVTLPDTVVATHLYRIAQEAVNNAVKHGRAKNIDIQLGQRNGSIVMSIADDGVGMPADLPNRPRAGDQGMGLRIMRYRANMVGAQLDILPNIPRGALVRCTLAKIEAFG